MDFARVHNKIAEAHTFLGKMTKQDSLMLSQGFQHYLSAFLTAGMSVRGGFQYRQDRKHNAAIKAWREKWENALTSEEKHLYDFVHVNRVAEVHTTGAAVTVETEPVKVGVGGPYSDRSGRVEGFGSPSVLLALGINTAAVVHKTTHHFTINGTKHKATEACAAYLELLQRMVAQCEADHP